MPEIKTSRVDIDYKIDAINRDYVILRFGFSSDGKNWRGARQLDTLIDDIQAESVVYAWGNFAYALFKRNRIDVSKLKQSIRERQDFEDITVQDAEPVSYYTQDEDRICGIFLARLMLNSLGASKSRLVELQYSNLTGTLLLVPPFKRTLRDKLEVAKVDIDLTDQFGVFRIGVRINTYRKKVDILKEYKIAAGKRRDEIKNALKSPQYIVHEGRLCLQRWVGEDDPPAMRTYIRLAVKGKRANRHFLDFSNTKSFEKCRAGILLSVMDDVKAHLGEYISITFAPQHYDQAMELDTTIISTVAKLRKKLAGHRIHIVDRVGSEQSKEMVEALCDTFVRFLPDPDLLSIGTNDEPGSLNYRVVHNESYYAENDVKDEYKASEDHCQRQHLTIEDTGIESLEPVVKTVLKEQLIKYDIANKRFSLFDWKNLAATGSWKFGLYEEDKPFRLMTIEPDGRFEFAEYDIQGLACDENVQKYLDVISGQGIKKLWSKGLKLEGVVEGPDGDVNVIYKSEVISIPDLNKIRDLIGDVDTPLPEGKRSGNTLSELISSFVDGYDGCCDKAKLFAEELAMFGEEEIPKNRFRIMLNEFVGKNTGLAQDVRTFLGKVHHIRLSFPKTGESLSELFDSNLNIKYFGISGTQAYYCVGERKASVQYSFKNACHLRKIVASNGSKLIFDQLLQCMNVDFVRTGQSTVIPVPFKYLREYIDMNKEREHTAISEAD